ncbi:hypothetical protein G8764_13540 [Pseudomaricurvus alcaniphilus]|uniref:hypothetical protein n=1 Tax=Pseudomaricurvus alcaniphilus TaxID=1166482 RepID=UPI00140DC976|nr:hypothetical protein [Pseudomaricurvus alcaniphilus]NHN38326.1 hypothetical protein [Pseudomaricurvus alcaniphilus]
MPVHIEHIVTDVTTQAEESEDGSPADPRFREQLNIEAALKRVERLRRRLSAESLDE